MLSKETRLLRTGGCFPTTLPSHRPRKLRRARRLSFPPSHPPAQHDGFEGKGCRRNLVSCVRRDCPRATSARLSKGVLWTGQALRRIFFCIFASLLKGCLVDSIHVCQWNTG